MISPTWIIKLCQQQTSSYKWIEKINNMDSGSMSKVGDMASDTLLWSFYVKCKMNYFWIYNSWYIHLPIPSSHLTNYLYHIWLDLVERSHNITLELLLQEKTLNNESQSKSCRAKSRHNKGQPIDQMRSNKIYFSCYIASLKDELNHFHNYSKNNYDKMDSKLQHSKQITIEFRKTIMTKWKPKHSAHNKRTLN